MINEEDATSATSFVRNANALVHRSGSSRVHTGLSGDIDMIAMIFAAGVLVAMTLGGGGCTSEEVPVVPSCGDGGADLADINRDGHADELDCTLMDVARAEAATCRLVDGLWWTQPKCASEASEVIPGFAALSPWDHVRALPNGSIALLRPEGLVIVTPRTGLGGHTAFAASAPLPDFGDRITSVGGVDDIAVASFSRAWYDRNNDALPTPDEVVDISSLGNGFAFRVQVLRINGHAAVATEVQGAVNAWQDLDDDLVVESGEVITFSAHFFLGISSSAIYFSRIGEPYVVATQPWTEDPSRVVRANISGLCRSLIPGTLMPGATALCRTEDGYLIDAVDGHRLAAGAFSSEYRQERHLVGRRLWFLNTEPRVQMWFDLNYDNVEQSNETFVGGASGTLAAFDATIDFRGPMDPYAFGANGITMTYGPSGSADTLQIVAWRRTPAHAHAGEPCLIAEQCPTGYVCERNGTSTESRCVSGPDGAP